MVKMSAFVRFKGPKLCHTPGVRLVSVDPTAITILLCKQKVSFSIEDHIKVTAYSDKTKCLQYICPQWTAGSNNYYVLKHHVTKLN